MRATPYWSVSPMRDQRIHAAEHQAGEEMSIRRAMVHFALM